VIEVVEYINAAGVSPFAKWREGLDATVKARITIVLDRVERGNFSAAKGVGAGVFELRLDFGPGYRVYFGKDGQTIVILLGGGTKQRQQADIDAARTSWMRYKQSRRKA
jgi:putative addiction module killer protein